MKHADRDSARKYIKLAGDGNELYGAHYDVNSPFKYNIIKFEDYTNKDLSSSLRELLVLHDCVNRTLPETKEKTSFNLPTQELSIFGTFTEQ